MWWLDSGTRLRLPLVGFGLPPLLPRIYFTNPHPCVRSSLAQGLTSFWTGSDVDEESRVAQAERGTPLIRPFPRPGGGKVTILGWIPA